MSKEGTMLGPNDLPFSVVGERCLIAESAPKERSEGGIYMPDNAKERYYSGKLLDAGLQARDRLFDAGVEIGDHVEFGRYAGLREAWDRIIEGDHSLADEAYDWKFLDAVAGVQRRYRCEKTGAVRAIDSIIVLNVDDIIASKQLAERRRSNMVSIKRGESTEGRTLHYVERVAA